ncbi:MAG: hypothetical protein U1E50_07960 [Caulobacteraceae bacterium]|mgnify:CR=1 FL=1
MYRAVLIVVALSLAACASTPVNSGCDRTCLASTLDAYLTAVATHDPEKAPLAGAVRSTENGYDVAIGAGVWTTVTGLGAVQRRYLDPVSGQAVYFGLVEETGGPAIVSLRIKVVDRRITEAEWVIGRKGDALYSPAGLIAEPPAVSPPLGLRERISRVDMAAAANSYFDGLQGHDGNLVRHVDGCVRLENGTRVTGRAAPAAAGNTAVEFGASDCASGLDRMTQINAVVLRRFPVVDEEAGVVVGTAMFLRPPGGALRRDGTPWPRLLLSEIFVLDRGQIKAIYAAMHYMTPEAPERTGW